MATVIRSPHVNDKPRRLKKEVSDAGEHADDARAEITQPETAAPPAQQVQVEIEETPGSYDEPAISPKEVAELHSRIDAAEERADKAEQALALLRDELESRRLEAREQGYAEGYEEARGKVDAECRDALENLEALAQGFVKKLDNLVFEAEDLIVETIYAAVLKIIGERLDDRENIAKMIRHVADQLIRAESFIVKLSPTDYDLLKASRKKLFPENQGPAIQLVSDKRIEMGGCVLESTGGSLDARLEVQLERLKEILLNSRARRQNELSGKT